jgi:hypothetical protein
MFEKGLVFPLPSCIVVWVGVLESMGYLGWITERGVDCDVAFADMASLYSPQPVVASSLYKVVVNWGMSMYVYPQKYRYQNRTVVKYTMTAVNPLEACWLDVVSEYLLSFRQFELGASNIGVDERSGVKIVVRRRNVGRCRRTADES